VDGGAAEETITGPGRGAAFSSNVRGWAYDGASCSPVQGLNFMASGRGYGANVACGEVDGDGL